MSSLKERIQKMKVAVTLEHTHPHSEFWKGWNKAINEVLDNLDALVPEKKLEELKQKLQQIVDNYSLVDDHGVALVSKRKLEELLKEDEKP